MGIIVDQATIRQELEDLQHQADYSLWMAECHQDTAAELQSRIDRLRQHLDCDHQSIEGCCPNPCSVDECGKTCSECGGTMITF